MKSQKPQNRHQTKKLASLPSGSDSIDPGWKITDLAEEYFLRCKLRNLSPGTIKLYRDDLGEFQRAIGIKTIGEITRLHVENFLAMKQNTVSPHSVHRYFRTFRAFFNVIAQNYSGFTSPMKNIKPPRLPSLPPKAISFEVIQKAVRFSGDKFIKRDSFFIRLLFDSALRLNECLSIKLEDIAENGAIIIRKGKGGKYRSIQLGDKTLLELKKYRRNLKDDDIYLFPSKKGTRLTGKHMRNRLKLIGDKLNIKLNPHRLRHSSARESILNGMDIGTLQSKCGWTSPLMALHYGKLFDVDILERQRKYSPGDKL